MQDDFKKESHRQDKLEQKQIAYQRVLHNGAEELSEHLEGHISREYRGFQGFFRNFQQHLLLPRVLLQRVQFS